MIVVGVCLLLLFLGLAALNAFRLSFLNPSTPGQIVLFTAISFIAFLLFLAGLLLLMRNVLKLYAEQRSGVLGARLRTRMLSGAVLLSLLPIGSMYGFSYLLMNRAIERWFSQPAAQLRDESSRIAVDLSRYVAANARSEAEELAGSIVDGSGRLVNDSALRLRMQQHDITLQGGFFLVDRAWNNDRATPHCTRCAGPDQHLATAGRVLRRPGVRNLSVLAAACSRYRAAGCARSPGGAPHRRSYPVDRRNRLHCQLGVDQAGRTGDRSVATAGWHDRAYRSTGPRQPPVLDPVPPSAADSHHVHAADADDHGACHVRDKLAGAAPFEAGDQAGRSACGCDGRYRTGQLRSARGSIGDRRTRRPGEKLQHHG